MKSQVRCSDEAKACQNIYSISDIWCNAEFEPNYETLGTLSENKSPRAVVDTSGFCLRHNSPGWGVVFTGPGDPTVVTLPPRVYIYTSSIIPAIKWIYLLRLTSSRNNGGHLPLNTLTLPILLRRIF